MNALYPNTMHSVYARDVLTPQFDAAAAAATDVVIAASPVSEPFRGVNDPDGQYDIDHQFADKSRDSDVGLFYFTRGHR